MIRSDERYHSIDGRKAGKARGPEITIAYTCWLQRKTGPGKLLRSEGEEVVS